MLAKWLFHLNLYLASSHYHKHFSILSHLFYCLPVCFLYFYPVFTFAFTSCSLEITMDVNGTWVRHLKPNVRSKANCSWRWENEEFNITSSYYNSGRCYHIAYSIITNIRTVNGIEYEQRSSSWLVWYNYDKLPTIDNVIIVFIKSSKSCTHAIPIQSAHCTGSQKEQP